MESEYFEPDIALWLFVDDQIQAEVFRHLLFSTACGALATAQFINHYLDREERFHVEILRRLCQIKRQKTRK